LRTKVHFGRDIIAAAPGAIPRLQFDLGEAANKSRDLRMPAAGGRPARPTAHSIPFNCLPASPQNEAVSCCKSRPSAPFLRQESPFSGKNGFVLPKVAEGVLMRKVRNSCSVRDRRSRSCRPPIPSDSIISRRRLRCNLFRGRRELDRCGVEGLERSSGETGWGS